MENGLKFNDNSFDIISLLASIDVMLAHCLAWVFQNGNGGVVLAVYCSRTSGSCNVCNERLLGYSIL